jgi:hypothetical protein
MVFVRIVTYACGSDGNGATMTDSVRLTAEWSVEADCVAVKYRADNGGATPVYVIDGRFRAGPGGVAAWSDRPMVGYRPPDTAVLGSYLTPLNPAVHSAFPAATFAVHLAAGEAHESTLTAPLPLVPDGMTIEPVPTAVIIGGKRIPPPFAGDPPRLADQSIVCRAAIFELGVIPHDESLHPQPAHLAGRAVFRLEKAAWSLQRIVTAVRRPIELPMRVPSEFAENARR